MDWVMIRSYLNIAFRNLFRHKTSSIINISGMAVGLAVCWLIALYVADEFSYDRFNKKADRIVRVVHHAVWQGGNVHLAVTSAPFAPALKATYPEVQEAIRIVPEGGGVITYQNTHIKADNIFFSDKNVFDIFSFPFLYGEPSTALSTPQTIVLTEGLAKKIFGDAQNALGQTIYFDNNFPNKITGVIKDIPGNSHLRFEALRSLPGNYTDNWQNSNLYTYLLLANGTDYKKLQEKLPQFAARTIEKEMKLSNYRMELQPLTSIHLHSDLQFEISPNNSISRIWLFMAIAVLILIIAVINYMNLSTARASLRVREVGVRKVIGSARRHLVAMFITEAVVTTLIAAILAFFLVLVSLPYLNNLADKNMVLWRFGIGATIFTLLGFALFTGFISGIYPAFFLSRFKTIAALKGQLGNLSNSILFRKSLVVFQFVVTVVMITGSWVIYRQMQYTSHKDLGFNRKQVLTFHIDDHNVRTQIASIKAQLLQNPLIKSVAAAGNPIGNNDLGEHPYFFENTDGSVADNPKAVQELVVDADYIPAMEIKMLQGRNFSLGMPSDKNEGALINETLMKELGWSNPIGKKLQFNIDNEGHRAERKIIGVVKDFHTYSLQHKVEPMVLLLPQMASAEDNLYVKINTSKTAEALAYINKVYKQFDKSNPVEFHFLDQNFARQYAAEQKQEQLSLIFTMLAVFIACMGLFGLAAFTAQQRVKEIGIRKVLGASVSSITIMLSKTYVKLIVVAICIATPVAWFAMNKWLEDFAYRTPINWWIFAAAGLVAIIIALITVSFQAIKAAIANPVKSIRTE
jgi:putative ABC transport system permease protein